jgi:tetratricopeptide (TPR) repeat protein
VRLSAAPFFTPKKMLMWRLILIGCMLFVGSLKAQDAKLAQQYYADGEFEKAVVLFEKLYAQEVENEYYFDRYIDCLLELQRYDDCEKILTKLIRRRPNDVKLYIAYGRMYEQQNKEDEALKQFRKAIEQMPKERYAVIKLANAFTNLNKFDLAIETFEKGARIINDSQFFAYQLADLYRRKGDIPKMITQYLNSLETSPDRAENIKTFFQRYLSQDDIKELRNQLYERVQANANAPQFVDVLAWVFLQEKDYKNALRQVRALDKQLKENGVRVYQLAQIAANDKDYDVAIDAYEYIVSQKGMESPFFLDAKQESLRCRRNKLVEGYSYTQEELKVLEQQYEYFISEFGKSRGIAPLIMELADLEAYYINNLPKAIELLTDLLKINNLPANIQGQTKLNLGDYYLMRGEIWESTLLYSQVDKAFKDDLLGNEARFRNARLSYYSGDFQWAQSQFDILKASTSKLISNDALDLSIFILENLGMDSTGASLNLYSQADLLIFQNRFDEAFQKLDSLLTLYPGNELEDDVLYSKAKVFMKKREFEKAAEMYQKILDKYPTEIRADNSLFALAELYEKQLNNKTKAKELYEKLFIDYSGSTFAVEARKRFRILRGDKAG